MAQTARHARIVGAWVLAAWMGTARQGQGEEYGDLLSQAQRAYEGKHAEKAVSLYLRAKTKRDTAEVALYLGLAYGEMKGRWDKSKQYCEEYLRREPSAAGDWLNEARACINKADRHLKDRLAQARQDSPAPPVQVRRDTPPPLQVKRNTPPPAPPEMVYVPAGKFMMGSNDGQADERPVHEVSVPAFFMDRTEVTVAAYRKCVEQKKCQARDTVKWTGISEENRSKYSAFCNWGKAGRDNHPINCVNWNDAKAYCEWAGKELPTEEQWEYAARGKDGRKYPWGAAEPDKQLCWQHKEGTCEVGSHPLGESPFHLQDMSGNVWEWTASQYCNSYVGKCKSSSYVVRGGSWSDDSTDHFRAANRDGLAPTFVGSDFGARCSRTASD